MSVPTTRGRPSLYTPELADEICRRLSEGETLRAICAEEGKPHATTVLEWVREDRDGISNRYARARELGFAAIGEEMMRIADEPVQAEKVTVKADGTTETVTMDAVERSRLRVDTRKWLLTKWAPKLFGDRSALEVTGKDGAPLVQVYLPDNRRDDVKTVEGEKS